MAAVVVSKARGRGGRPVSPPRAFTLVELLVVVAIVAALVSLALVNLALANARGKVARVQADHAALATALEAYAVDNAQRYPDYGHPLDYARFAGEPVVFTPLALTTPVAYFSALPLEVFRGRRTGLPRRAEPPYFYMHDYDVVYLGKRQYAGHVAKHYRVLTGRRAAVQWTVWSFGPDRDDDHGLRLYDPSNGTISNGDLMRFGP